MKKHLALFLILLAPCLSSGQKLYPFLFKNQQSGFVNEQLQVKIKASYDFVSPLHDGIAAVQLKDAWGFIDATGKRITPLEYVDFNSWNEGLIPVQNREGRWGYLNYQGRVAIPFIFDEANTFRFGRAPASKNQKYGMIDRSGKFVIASTSC